MKVPLWSESLYLIPFKGLLYMVLWILYWSMFSWIQCSEKTLNKLLRAVFSSEMLQSFSEYCAPLRILTLVTCLKVYYLLFTFPLKGFIDGYDALHLSLTFRKFLNIERISRCLWILCSRRMMLSSCTKTTRITSKLSDSSKSKSNEKCIKCKK